MSDKRTGKPHAPKPSTHAAVESVHGYVIAADHASHPDTQYWCGNGESDFRPDLQQAIRLVSAKQAEYLIAHTIGSELSSLCRVVPFVASTPAEA